MIKREKLGKIFFHKNYIYSTSNVNIYILKIKVTSKNILNG